jgi:type VI secretion system protein
MPIILNLETYDPALGENELRRIEVASRLTIGRGSDNDLVLPDPQRHLSKTHCIIVLESHGGTITDTSTNGVFLDGNAERLPRNVPTPISDGSVLRFGGYQIKVVAIAPTLPAAAEPPSPMAAQMKMNSAPIDDGLFGDPLAAPSEGPEISPAIFPSDAPVDQGFDPPRGEASFGSSIPDDIDLFVGNEAPQQWHGTSQPDHTPSNQGFFAPPKVVSQKIPDDWDLSEFERPAKSRPPERLSGAGFAHSDPRPPEPAQRAPLAQVPSRGRTGPSDSAAVASFLTAIGLKEAVLSESERIRVMQLAGETFALMARGLTEILAARASTKQEFRIDRTVIGAARNNPLKFSGSVAEAIHLMLLGRSPGFLQATEAVEEALDDIKNHHLAVLAGMQVALATVIARFDPDKLEGRLDQHSLIEGILPAARKARYWDLFKSLYRDIATELEEDFQKAFGAEFARAYRKQIDQL